MSATIYPSLEFISFPQSRYTLRYLKFVAYWSSRTTVEILGYTERHHIYPKSIFGTNQTLVVLTAKEHFVAHKLLAAMYDITDNRRNHYKMMTAFSAMSMYKEKRSLSSRQYSECKNARLGCKRSSETCQKISESMRIAAQKMKDSGYVYVISDEGRANNRILKGNAAKKFNFIHTSGLEERNISTPDLIRKYPDQKLHSGNLHRGRIHKGWRINDPSSA